MVLTAGELEQMRAEIDSTLPATCEIHRATRTQNDSGGWSEVYAEVAEVPCRVSPLGQRESVLASRIAVESDHIIRVPALTDVRAGDRIVEFNVVYEVVGPPQGRSEELVRGVFARMVS